jgi:hypothetical protein
MFLSAYLAILCGQLPVDARAGENKLTQLELKVNPNGLAFDWADTDESLRGQVTPQPVRAGRTMTVSAVLQPLTGDDFTGPITFSLRPLNEMGSAQSLTVSRKPGERGWVAEFTPAEATDYRLEMSWRTTHHKVVRGVFPVSPGGLPAWVTWVVGGGLIAIALAIGLWVLFGRKESPSS